MLLLMLGGCGLAFLPLPRGPVAPTPSVTEPGRDLCYGNPTCCSKLVLLLHGGVGVRDMVLVPAVEDTGTTLREVLSLLCALQTATSDGEDGVHGHLIQCAS